MRAVVIATGLNSDLCALNERHPLPMLLMADRPFIQHIVEYLVDRGVTEFDFVLSHLPEKIEHLLGNGARWGCQFRFHLTRGASRPYGALKSLGPEAAGPILLAHADRLPQLPENLQNHIESRKIPSLYCLRDASISSTESVWTGWAWLSEQYVAALPSDVDEKELESVLMSAAREQGSIIEIGELLSVRSYEEMLAAQSAVLNKTFSGLVLSGSEAESGIWISRNVSLHPTARLIAPVYVGENCRIGMGTHLGPNAVIGHNCVLDARCSVANSVIFPGSYAGEALELEDVIVDKNLLVNVRLGAAIPVVDDFILGSLSDTQLRAGFVRLLGRIAAVVLLVLTWPALLATALFLKLTRRGPVLAKRECVSLPAPADEAQWRSFRLWSFQPEPALGGVVRSRWSGLFLHFLPALINIARGELRFVGVCPRSKEEVKLLSHDWQALYLRTKAGIVTEAEVHYGAYPDDDELYSAEAFYSATAGFRHDLRLMLRYFGLFLKAPSVAPEGREEWNAGSETVTPKF